MVDSTWVRRMQLRSAEEEARVPAHHPATTGRDAGAPWSVAMGPYIVRGTYQEVDPPRRLSFTWAFDHEADAPPALVTVDLQHAVQGTLVTVTHDGFTDEADRAGVEQGWTLSLDRLLQII